MKESYTLTIMCLFLIFMFKHPLLLMLCLVTQSLSVLTFIYMSMWNMWNAFMLILIFLGGLLIIFIYLTALTPNELFKESVNFTKGLMTLGASVMLLHNLTPTPLLHTKENFFFPNIFNIFLNNFFIMMMIYLMATLFSTMNLCAKSKSPLKINT
uniref:NADH dehydogenase subunit 6 n=1 Tax=Hypsibius dujardini TaxID=232323 RepID=E7BBB7_HYPDU|nr:NADH dehydrogenase subunit 6 [Hypsibius dujardini]CBY83898.1 NADH dehydogenase subunit 6 [Hypsibius dujardini]